MGSFTEREADGCKEPLGKNPEQIPGFCAEVEMQDVHQTIVIAVAAIASHQAQADSKEEEILKFVERSTEAEIVESETQIR